MKRKVLLAIVLCFSFILFGAGCSLQSNAQKVLKVDEEDGHTSLNKKELIKVLEDKKETDTVMTEDQKQDIWFILEEEKMARDLYYKFYQKYDKQIFEKLYKAENTHFKSVQQLVRNYNLEDLTSDKGVGEFENPQIQMMYDELLAKGNKNFKEALKVGAQVEDRDIKDLEENISNTNKGDVIFVFKNLQRASRNHLRAFMRNIEKEGGSYESQYLSKEKFEEITSSGVETGAWWKFWE